MGQDHSRPNDRGGAEDEDGISLWEGVPREILWLVQSQVRLLLTNHSSALLHRPEQLQNTDEQEEVRWPRTRRLHTRLLGLHCSLLFVAGHQHVNCLHSGGRRRHEAEICSRTKRAWRSRLFATVCSCRGSKRSSTPSSLRCAVAFPAWSTQTRCLATGCPPALRVPLPYTFDLAWLTARVRGLQHLNEAQFWDNLFSHVDVIKVRLVTDFLCAQDNHQTELKRKHAEWLRLFDSMEPEMRSDLRKYAAS